MSSIVDFAIAILSQAEKRVEIAGQNMANAATPAYKRKIPFSTLVQMNTDGEVIAPKAEVVTDFTSGKLSQTGSPSDLAIAGPGYFALRSEAGRRRARGHGGPVPRADARQPRSRAARRRSPRRR